MSEYLASQNNHDPVLHDVGESKTLKTVDMMVKRIDEFLNDLRKVPGTSLDVFSLALTMSRDIAKLAQDAKKAKTGAEEWDARGVPCSDSDDEDDTSRVGTKCTSVRSSIEYLLHPSSTDIAVVKNGQGSRRNSKRESVSAEAYGEYNKEVSVEEAGCQKEVTVISELISYLKDIATISQLNCSDEELEKIAATMTPKYVEGGEQLFVQGDCADGLYVVQSGILDVIRQIEDQPNFGSFKLRECREGHVFGELGLLYPQPRAASVVAQCRSVVYFLSREKFNHMRKKYAASRKKTLIEKLQEVPFFSDLDTAQISNLSDLFKELFFKSGERVIEPLDEIARQKLFVVLSGNCYLESRGMLMDAGWFFGSSIAPVPIDCAVTANTTAKIVSIEERHLDSWRNEMTIGEKRKLQ